MQHLTKDELRGLLMRAKVDSLRNYLMILVGYWHGLRVSEITSLTAEQIQDGYINVQRLKGSMRTIQPIVKHSDPLLDESQLIEYAAGKQGKLFKLSRKCFWEAIQRYGKQAGIPEHKCHPHILKHSIAMHTIKQAGIENVRQYLGHINIGSTGAYLKVSDDAASKAITSAAGEN